MSEFVLAAAAFFTGLDPLVQAIVGGGAVFILIVFVLWLIRRRRDAIAAARRREEYRQQFEASQQQQQETARLATRIITTSSQATIAGFEIIRQIEAVMTDGHTSPTKAVESLKAVAAQKGGNAIINLISEKEPGGKYFARGDAVMVKLPGSK